MPNAAAARTASATNETTMVPTRCWRATAPTLELLMCVAGAGAEGGGATGVAPLPDIAGEVEAAGTWLSEEADRAGPRPEPLSRCRRFKSLRISEACW